MNNEDNFGISGIFEIGNVDKGKNFLFCSMKSMIFKVKF